MVLHVDSRKLGIVLFSIHRIHVVVFVVGAESSLMQPVFFSPGGYALYSQFYIRSLVIVGSTLQFFLKT